MSDPGSPNKNNENKSSAILQLLQKDQQKLLCLNFLAPDELTDIRDNVKDKIVTELLKFANCCSLQAQAHQKERLVLYHFIRDLQVQLDERMSQLDQSTTLCYTERENVNNYMAQCGELQSQLTEAETKISQLEQKLTEVHNKVVEVTQVKEDSLGNQRNLEAEIEKLTKSLEARTGPDDLLVFRIEKVDACTTTTRAESWPNYYAKNHQSSKKISYTGDDGNIKLTGPTKPRKKQFNHNWYRCNYG